MNLNHFIEIMRGRFRLIWATIAVTVVVAALINFALPRMYTASTSLVIDFRGSDPFDRAMLPTQLQDSYMVTQLDILKSERVALKVVDKLDLADTPELREALLGENWNAATIRHSLAQSLLNNLSFEPLRDSRVVKVHFSSEDSALALKVLEAFIESYIETNLELSVVPAQQSKTWFDDQLKVLRSQVEEAQSKLTTYQQQHRIVATDDRIDMETARLASLSEQLVNAQAQTFEAESRLRRIQQASRAGSVDNLPEVLANPFLQTLKGELLRQETRLDELSRQFGVNHPQYQRASTEVQSTRAKFNQEIDALLVGENNTAKLAREREKTLETAVAEQKERVLELKRQHDDINVLRGEIESAKLTYDAALQRFNQISLESQVTQTNIAVLTEPVEPVSPSSPKILRNMTLSVFLGALLGLGLALLSEMLDRRVRSESDLEESLGVPVLGVLKGSA